MDAKLFDLMLEILKYIQSFSNPILDSFFELVTMLGEDLFIIIVIAIFYWCFNKTFGYKLAFAYLSTGAINTIIKEIVKLPRPIGYEGIKSRRVETAGGYSFPSGHTQKASALFATLMIEFRKKWLSLMGLLAIFLVGFSRMYLGVHWPIDVIGGWIIGVIWTKIAIKMFDRSKDKQNPLLLGFIVIPMFICLKFFRTATYYKYLGALISLWIGYIIEDKYINYVVKAIWWKQIVKLLIGFLGLILINGYVRKLLPINLYGDFIAYSLMGGWMTVISPIIYRVLHIEERPYGPGC